MKEKLREELIKLATDIITARDEAKMATLYAAAKNLYEKITVLKYLEEQSGGNSLSPQPAKNEVADKFEKMANAVLRENKSVPENNPHAEDIAIPGMETIKHMVSEMPSKENLEEVLTQFLAKPDLMKNDKELFTPTEADLKNPATTSVNERLASKDLKVDLNNRLAFVKHLFNDSMEDYNRVLSQLNTIETHERSIAFINNMVKPDYNNWEGKEEYELRFLEILERRFT